MSTRPVTIVLVEDHQVVRQGVRALLESERGIRIVGEAGDGLEALRLVEQLAPDVLVIDLMIPGLSGLEVTRRVGLSSPRTRVVILSMYSNEPYVLEALRNGAAGYVLKDSSAADLVQAVRTVMDGRRYISPPLSEMSIERYQLNMTRSAPLDPYETLTNREREVLQMTAEGLNAPQIAYRLAISSRTVETHRANLMRKLGLHSQAELIRYALRRGIIPLDG